MLISKSRYLSLFNVFFFFSTKHFIIFGKVADQGHRGLARTNARTSYCTQTTRNTKASTLTVTLLINTTERIRRIVTAITVAPKEAWVPFVFNLLFLHRERFLSQSTPCVPHCENQNHYCHTDYQQHKSCGSQTWYTLFFSNSYRFYTYIPDTMILICHYVYEVHFSFSWERILFLNLHVSIWWCDANSSSNWR